jgi:hypothetical protein
MMAATPTVTTGTWPMADGNENRGKINPTMIMAEAIDVP